jgi:4-hydroxy-tetrahydrodipicolinate synthase
MAAPAFSGIIPPLVTPLDDQCGLDLGGLERLVERVIAGGVQGVFVLGTTGEGPSLPHTLRQQVVAAVCDQVAGRVPVLVGITDTIADASVELTDAAFAAGAAAAVLAPPYYLEMTQAELTSYTVRLAERLALPLMLYNMPSCCKTWYDVDTVVELSDHDRILGLKDSSGDLNYFQRVVERLSDRPDFALFVGPEELLTEALARGGHGGVHGGANMFPQLYTELYAATVQGRAERAAQLHQLVMDISATIYAASEGPSRVIKGTKTVLSLLEICGDQMAEPFVRHETAAREAIRSHLDRLLPRLGALASQTPVR